MKEGKKMSTLKADLNRANRLIQCGCSSYEKFERLYPFSNENLVGLFSNLNFMNKDCLTVLGGSDLAFDMYLNGAKSITAFDKNPLTKYYFYLKKAALLANLTLEEYLKFFCYRNFGEFDNRDAFNEKVFSKIVSYLDGDYYQFWSTLFETYSSSKIRHCQEWQGGSIFSYDEMTYTVLQKTIGYLNEQNYYLLRDQAKNLDISFLHSDINCLLEKLKQHYDIMYFSNIIQYVDNMYSNELARSFSYQRNEKLSPEEKQIFKLTKYKKLMFDLSTRLKENGIMIIGYLYTLNEENKNVAIFNSDIREMIFPKDEFHYLLFQAVEELEDKDLYGVGIPGDDAGLVYVKKR